jgi:hypothetical protein
MAAERQIDIPPTAFGYFFGHRDNGARFLVGARNRPAVQEIAGKKSAIDVLEKF